MAIHCIFRPVTKMADKTAPVLGSRGLCPETWQNFRRRSKNSASFDPQVRDRSFAYRCATLVLHIVPANQSAGPWKPLRIEFIYRIKQVCRTTMLHIVPDLQSDLQGESTGLVVEARARGQFFWASATKKWTIIDWKVNVSKPAPIHGEHQSPAQWPHTRIFPGQTKLVLQPRSSTQTYNQEPNNIQQTYAKPTFSRSPKPTNDKRPTNQKEWLSAKYTWNALAQVWSAPFEEAPGLQC